MDFLEEVKSNQNIVLEVHAGFHRDNVLKANKLVSDKFGHILYVTTTKPFTSMKAELEKEGIDLQKYRFVDCVSKKAALAGAGGNAIFVDSPKSLTELAIAISGVVKLKEVDLLFFDSVSPLLVYNDELKVVKFLHYLMVLIKENKTKGIFVIMANDLARKVVREIELFADVISWIE